MPRPPTRFVPALALSALLFISPSSATALPLGQAGLSVAKRAEASPGLFSQLWGLLSAVWATGPNFEPDGANTGLSSGSGTETNAGTGDTGSGLDPDGDG